MKKRLEIRDKKRAARLEFKKRIQTFLKYETALTQTQLPHAFFCEFPAQADSTSQNYLVK
jgi:hypothetical protein